jgi:hypothetical protein
MSLEGNISEHQKTRIREFIKQGSTIKLEIQDQQEALKDLGKTIGEEIDVKPALLLKALNIAFKNKADDERENFTTVEEILAVAGVI